MQRLSSSSTSWLRSKTCMCPYFHRYFAVAHQARWTSQIKKPSLSTGAKHIYFQAPPQLEQATRPNLEKKISDLVPHGGDITVTATTLPFNLTLRINYA